MARADLPGRRRFSPASPLAAVALLLALALARGCGTGLPRLSPSGEPVEAGEYVTSIRIDPRTLKPIEEETKEKTGKETKEETREEKPATREKSAEE